MPYKSREQAAYMHIHHPKIAAKWDAEINSRKKRKISKSSPWTSDQSKVRRKVHQDKYEITSYNPVSQQNYRSSRNFGAGVLGGMGSATGALIGSAAAGRKGALIGAGVGGAAGAAVGGSHLMGHRYSVNRYPRTDSKADRKNLPKNPIIGRKPNLAREYKMEFKERNPEERKSDIRANRIQAASRYVARTAVHGDSPVDAALYGLELGNAKNNLPKKGARLVPRNA